MIQRATELLLSRRTYRPPGSPSQTRPSLTRSTADSKSAALVVCSNKVRAQLFSTIPAPMISRATSPSAPARCKLEITTAVEPFLPPLRLWTTERWFFGERIFRPLATQFQAPVQYHKTAAALSFLPELIQL